MKILFVSNEAARTGAPAILMGLLKWLQTHYDLETTCVLMRDGALREEFEQLGRTYTWTPTDLNRPERIYKRLATVLLKRGHTDPGLWLQEIINKENPDIIYLSTLVLGKYLQQFTKRPNQRIITHVHELLPSLRQLSGDHLVSGQLALSDTVIACATCVAETLSDTYRLPNQKCIIIPEYIIPETLKEGSVGDSGSRPFLPSEEPFLAKLSQAIDQRVPIFGIGGNPINRKGFDLFPLLIKECKTKFGATPFLAVWIGCATESDPGVAMAWDLKQMGLEDDVALIPSVSMPTFRWILSQFRVLTLLSREDPFPLVVLEAGLLGVPTVCFKGSGAIPEFASEGQCISVNYLDLPAFAKEVHRLCLHHEEGKSIGGKCREKIRAELTLDQVAPRVAQVLLNAKDRMN